MYALFWKSLFSGLMIFFLFSNIAFAFDMVNLVNVSAVPLGHGDFYHNYYFGISSFIDSFKTWFGNNSALSGFSKLITRYGEFITKSLSIFTQALTFSKTSSSGNILRYVIGIFLWVNSIFPIVFGIGYVVLFVLYLIFIAFQILAFIVYWFGGGFMTPLPDTSWWDTGHFPVPDTTPLLFEYISAMMV